jgi:hypothetical protein
VSHRTNKYRRPARPLLSSHPHAEVKADRRWIVRDMSGAQATKEYRCPGCGALIAPGTAHLVVWPSSPSLGSDRAVDDRRHWHTACWRRHRG